MTRHNWFPLLVPALAAAILASGCGADDGYTAWDGMGDTGGWDTSGDTAGDTLVDTYSDIPTETPGDDCAERARWVYLVAEDKSFLRFYPDIMNFELVGTLSCPVGALATPFSMSVDRNADAWILYAPALGSGQLLKVSTEDASCEATSFSPGQNGFELFGMGFASNSSGSSDETLFVAGGSALSIGTGNAQLGWIDMTSLILSPIGSVQGWPEMTGTGAGELWGFDPYSTPPSVVQLDKWSGSVLYTYNTTITSGVTEAWAFAFWGGDFYVFFKIAADASTKVYKLETSDGSTSVVVPDSGYKIVGAGVSTCAPVVFI